MKRYKKMYRNGQKWTNMETKLKTMETNEKKVDKNRQNGQK